MIVLQDILVHIWAEERGIHAMNVYTELRWRAAVRVLRHHGGGQF